MQEYLETIYNGGSGGGGGGGNVTTRLANIMPTTGVKVVDAKGWIGGDYLNPYYPGNQYYNSFAIVIDGADFKNVGFGKVTFVDTSATIGGRVYPTVTINGVTWMAENLDYKFSGVGIGGTSYNKSQPWAWYQENNETKWGYDGRKCGLLYNYHALYLLENNKSELIPGWHCATVNEYDSLISYLGGLSISGKRLKSISLDWCSNWGGLDDYGFKMLPSGYIGSSGPQQYTGTYGYLMAYDSNPNNKYSYVFSVNNNVSKTSFVSNSYNIRLVKDV